MRQIQAMLGYVLKEVEAGVGVEAVVITNNVTTVEMRGMRKEWRCYLSAMVLSDAESFAVIAKSLEKYGIKNIHFCSIKEKMEVDATAIAFVPFVDFIIIGKDAGCASHLENILQEAKERQIPVLTESCIVR